MGKRFLFFIFVSLYATQEERFRFIKGPQCIVVWDSQEGKFHYLYDDGKNETKKSHPNPCYAVVAQKESEEFYAQLRYEFELPPKSASKVE